MRPNMTAEVSSRPKVRVNVIGAAGATAHPMWSVLAHQDVGAIRTLNDAVRFVACVRNPERDRWRLTQSPNYDGLFTQYDSIQWLDKNGTLILNGLPIEVKKTEAAMETQAKEGDWRLAVDYTPDNSTWGTGQWVDQYGNNVGLKPQAFKDKDDNHWHGIPPSEHPHVIPNINDHKLSLETQLVSQASCTTGGAAAVLKVLAEGIPGIRILKGGSALTTFHGATNSDGAPDVVHGPLATTTGAGKALKIIFGDSLPGIENLAASAIRAAWEVPSMIQLNLVTESDIELDYKVVHGLFEAAANNPRYRMMLGLYYQQGKELAYPLFKREGRTSVLVADPDNLLVEKLADRNLTGKYIYNIRMNKIFYDNVFGYVCNTIDLIFAIINRAAVLPSPLSQVDKPRLPHIFPNFDTGKLLGVPAELLDRVKAAAWQEMRQQQAEAEMDDL